MCDSAQFDFSNYVPLYNDLKYENSVQLYPFVKKLLVTPETCLINVKTTIISYKQPSMMVT